MRNGAVINIALIRLGIIGCLAEPVLVFWVKMKIDNHIFHIGDGMVHVWNRAFHLKHWILACMR
jgi:hypothetical protein